jgi:hypothetical protein
MDGPARQYTEALLRHFADLRDGAHGGATSRQDKERFFAQAVSRCSTRTPADHSRSSIGMSYATRVR